MDVKDSLLSGVSLYNSLIKDYSFVLLLIFALENLESNH